MTMDSETKFAGAAQKRVDEIYAALRERICLLHYPPGTRLSEAALAAEFKVSRTPIRRVLQRLEFEHLAERRQGVQTMVTHFDLPSVEDVYELRMVFAENLYRLAAAPDWQAHAAELRSLRGRCDALRGGRDVQAMGRIHMALQQEISAMVANERAREMMDQLYYQIARIWLHLIEFMDWPQEVGALCNELDAIVEAVEHGDIRAVGLIRRNYIAMNIVRMRRVLEHLPGMPSESPTG